MTSSFFNQVATFYVNWVEIYGSAMGYWNRLAQVARNAVVCGKFNGDKEPGTEEVAS